MIVLRFDGRSTTCVALRRYALTSFDPTSARDQLTVIKRSDDLDTITRELRKAMRYPMPRTCVVFDLRSGDVVQMLSNTTSRADAHVCVLPSYGDITLDVRSGDVWQCDECGSKYRATVQRSRDGVRFTWELVSLI